MDTPQQSHNFWNRHGRDATAAAVFLLVPGLATAARLTTEIVADHFPSPQTRWLAETAHVPTACLAAVGAALGGFIPDWPFPARLVSALFCGGVGIVAYWIADLAACWLFDFAVWP